MSTYSINSHKRIETKRNKHRSNEMKKKNEQILHITYTLHIYSKMNSNKNYERRQKRMKKKQHQQQQLRNPSIDNVKYDRERNKKKKNCSK